MTPLRPGNEFRQPLRRRFAKGFSVAVFTLAGLGWGAILTMLIVGAVMK